MTTMEKNYNVLEYVDKHQEIFKPSDLGYNLAQMMRYAKEKGVKISELTPQEVHQFKIISK